MGKLRNFVNEFKEFALKGNVMSMAVGVLIGGAFSSVVTSFTTNIITPVLNCFGGIDEGQAAELAIKIGKLNMPIGVFLADVVNFIIMALIIFLMVKAMNKLMSIGKKPEEPAAPAEPTTRICPYCKSEIAIDAVRCPHCTSELEAEEQ